MKTTYRNPPITEAIIDVRVAPRTDLSLAVLENLCTDTKHDFPQIAPVVEAKGTLIVGLDSATTSAEQTQIGFRSVSSDAKSVCQRRLNGFTFSRLAPYQSWGPFRDLAKYHWNTYRGSALPASLVRLAVRYINKITIPHAPIELKDYFRTAPEISSDLPQLIDGFFMQVRLPQPDIDAMALINQTIVPSAADCVSVILDIDLGRSESVPMDENDIWDYFETLHARKNVIFEACITAKTRELFE